MGHEQVLVDETWLVGEGSQCAGTCGQDDVVAVLFLHRGQLRTDVTGHDDAATGRVVDEGGREDDLGEPDQQLCELVTWRGDRTSSGWRVPCGDLLPVGDDELVELPAHRPGVGGAEGVVDVGGLGVPEPKRFPERTSTVADSPVESDLHVDDELAHQLDAPLGRMGRCRSSSSRWSRESAHPRPWSDRSRSVIPELIKITVVVPSALSANAMSTS